jgi:hypothetical protein
MLDSASALGGEFEMRVQIVDPGLSTIESRDGTQTSL